MIYFFFGESLNKAIKVYKNKLVLTFFGITIGNYGLGIIKKETK